MFKRLSILFFLLIFVVFYPAQTVLKDSSLEVVEVAAIRASDKMPIAHTNVKKEVLDKKNVGQDLPYFLQNIPGFVAFSDAGNGIGYTGFRIRGSDAQRTNLTINGVPYNDAESQGLFLVNIPDLVASSSSIQVQRGVGTSTQGAGAFGASINLNTNTLKEKQSLSIENTFGSFNSWRNSVNYNSGLIKNKISFDARLSSIRSDGFIDRAKSNLQSFYLSGIIKDATQSLRLNVFGGKERTYQAWYGVPAQLVATQPRYNSAGTEKPGEPYNNETDNYQQYHYHLVYNKKFLNGWMFSHTGYLTTGAGYYEQYKANSNLQTYGINSNQQYDIIRQLWLQNTLLGNSFSLTHAGKKTDFVVGGGANRYLGNHFGKLKEIIGTTAFQIPNRYYDFDATKSEQNLFFKLTERHNRIWKGFADLQFRAVQYTIEGFRNNPMINVESNYFFLNPKFGFSKQNKNFKQTIYFGIANKEPNRDDFETATTSKPKHETLYNIEFSNNFKIGNFNLGINSYLMYYKNQLVLNGKINDVGAYTRVNVPKSYRVGIENTINTKLLKNFEFDANFTLSSNRILDYDNYIDDYDNQTQIKQTFKNTQIAFSPNWTHFLGITYQPNTKFAASFTHNLIGRQYLDNTENENGLLRTYHFESLSFSFNNLLLSKLGKFTLQLTIQNILNKNFLPNGYSFTYINQGVKTTESFVYPNAGTTVFFTTKIGF